VGHTSAFEIDQTYNKDSNGRRENDFSSLNIVILKRGFYQLYTQSLIWGDYHLFRHLPLRPFFGQVSPYDAIMGKYALKIVGSSQNSVPLSVCDSWWL
jgi:hypothetical protein